MEVMHPAPLNSAVVPYSRRRASAPEVLVQEMVKYVRDQIVKSASLAKK